MQTWSYVKPSTSSLSLFASLSLRAFADGDGRTRAAEMKLLEAVPDWFGADIGEIASPYDPVLCAMPSD